MASLSQTLKGELQKAKWVTKDDLDSNRYMFWSTVSTDLSPNGYSFQGYRITSGQNVDDLIWYGRQYKSSILTTGVLEAAFIKRNNFPLGTPYGPLRSMQGDSDSNIGCDYFYPGDDYMRKMNHVVQTAGYNGTDLDTTGIFTRVVRAEHKFICTNFGRHPIQLICVFKGQKTIDDEELFLESNSIHIGELANLPNAQAYILPGGQAGDDAGVTSSFTIPFSPGNLDVETYKQGPLSGTTSGGVGSWRQVYNAHASTAPYLHATSRGETVFTPTINVHQSPSPDGMNADTEVDDNRTSLAGYVRFYARQMLPTANNEAAAYSAKTEGAQAPLGDAYRSLNISVQSRFLNEVVKTETNMRQFTWNPRYTPYADQAAVTTGIGSNPATGP